MLAWAAATFDALGVMNERGQRAVPLVLELAAYLGRLERNQLDPGGWAAALFTAADEGRIEPGDVSGMLFDYVAPSLDTTILGTGHLLFQLGQIKENQVIRPLDRPGGGVERLRSGRPHGQRAQPAA